MSFHSNEQKRFGLAKETVRGTAEAAATVWKAVDPESELTYARQLIDDNTLRGLSAMQAPAPGVKVGEGSIKFPARANQIGEFLQMIMGDPTTAQIGATPAYRHTFEPVNAIQLPAYTLFMDRGQAVKAYSLGQCSKLEFASGPDDLAIMTASMMFKAEAAGSIGSPDYTDESEELGFNCVNVEIAGTPALDVKNWSVSIENALFPHRVLAKNEDVADLLRAGKFKVTGTMLVYFQTATERDKFIAGDQADIRFLLEGADIPASTPDKFTLDLDMENCRYRAYAYGQEDNLLSAAVEFEAFYNTATSRIIKAEIINEKTAY